MKRQALVAISALLLGAAADALVVDVWTETTLRFTNLGAAEASATATGLATLNTSSTTSSHLSTATLPGATLITTVPVTDPNAAPITAVVFSVFNRPDLQGGGRIGNISGAIASPDEGIGPNTLPMTGMAVFCIFSQFTCLPQLNLPLAATSAGDWVGQGIGGILTVGGTGSIRISVVGAPYTVGTVSVVNRTNNGALDIIREAGFAHGPASLTSSTAATSGVLQIVSASRIPIVAPGDDDRGGSISRILVHVVPEPALLLLFGAGAIGLAGIGRMRR